MSGRKVPTVGSPKPSPAAADEVGYQTRSLTRALAILDAFSAERTTLSVKDIHEELKLPKPTVSRLAGVLKQYGFLRGAGDAYQLGPKAFQLGALFARQHRIQDLGYPPLQSMAVESQQTSCLALLAGRSVVNIIVAKPPRPIHHVTDVGMGDYAHATGLGKALLARLLPEEIDRLFGGDPLVRLTENTITELTALHRELKRTRERGHAIDREETAVGLRCVAVAVELPQLGAAAISVSGPAAEYSDSSIPQFLALLRSAAANLQTAFDQATGYALAAPGELLAAVAPEGMQSVSVDRRLIDGTK